MIMGLGKQAKILSKEQQKTVLMYLGTTRYSLRNKVIFLLSVKSGLRAKEIAGLEWSMITDAEGNIGDTISLQNKASKGKSGRTIYLNGELKAALEALKNDTKDMSGNVVRTARSKSTSPQVIVNTMRDWYMKLGFEGCSSHSGRRSFITSAAKKISQVGGSLRDVQALAGHSSLNMTQRYIESDEAAKRKVVELI